MHQNGYIARKMRLPELQPKPAIVIAAFGSTSRAKIALDLFSRKLAEHYPDQKIYWAYTSEIIRKKLGLPSLQETLARVEADGYRKAVVQALHIFPGTEYQQLAETCSFFPGMRVFLGESLLHRWEFVNEILDAIEPEFLSPQEGYNLMAIHGTPLAADPANIIYLGLERLLADRYPNVGVAAVEGVPDHGAVFARMAREDLAGKYRRIKIIPMMYFAGLHAEEDLMGDTDSWRTALEEQGFEVDCPMTAVDGKEYFKGLAHYPEVNDGFLSRLERIYKLASYY
ncbi:MAG: sirohydrochlorin cobaltochelatase [Desulfobacter sp.]|nr:MAG: sirohydrochlorin cobaltochelatase [Desulfobacter sp.]